MDRSSHSAIGWVVSFAILIGLIAPLICYTLAGMAVIDPVQAPFRESPRYEQWAVVASFFGIKTIYTVMAAGIIASLWRRRETDLRVFRWAMIFFFIGEALCAVNVLGFHDRSPLLEHLHSIGMVLSLGYFAYAVLDGSDARIVHYSDAGRCAAAGLCRRCAKHADVPCGLRRAFVLLIVACAITASVPLFSRLREVTYDTRVLGAMHRYGHPVVHQLYETRYLPIVAMAFFAACLMVVTFVERRAIPLSKLLFSAGAGAMGFSLLRMILVTSFEQDQVWFAVWEETSELLYIGMVAGVLYVFRDGLLHRPTHEGAET